MSAPNQAETSHLIELDAGWRAWRVAALRSAGLPFAMVSCLAVPGELALPKGRDRDAAIRARQAAAVESLLANDTLVSALVWQNPKAVTDWITDYRAQARAGQRAANRRDAGRRAFIARCAQRYCVKNDTIGFFGPVAWARLGAAATGYHGAGKLISGDVSFEVWAVHAIADAWAADPDLLGHLPVRLDPACAVDGDIVRRPHRPPVPLDPVDVALVSALGPVRRVGELAAACGLSLPAVAQRLTALAAQRVIQLGFLVPLDDAPEAHLRRQVAEIADRRVAAELTATLDRLDQVKDSLAAVALSGHDDPERLLAALREVDRELLAAANGRAPSAPRGRAPGRRTPVYLDCLRDLDATVGTAEIGRLAKPLAVLLDSARWLTWQVGELVADGLRQRFEELRGRKDVVTLGDLQFAAADVLATGGGGLGQVTADFEQRWAQIISDAAVITTPSEIVLDVSRARQIADSLFPARLPRWALGRLHSPDLMLAQAPDGAMRWVLGELHLALNTVESRTFRTQAHDEEELVAAVRSDLRAGRVVPVYPYDGTLVSSRTYPPPALDPPGLFRYWSYATDDGHLSGAPSAPAAGLQVHEVNGELIAVAPADAWAAPVMECFGEFVSAVVVNLFRIRPPQPQGPRLSLGDLVISRLSWRFRAAEVPVPGERSNDVAHDRLRDWAASHGVPRHVFVRTPAERKPFYVDFSAPLLIDNLARAVRKVRSGPAKAQWIEITEMLPSPSELWLTDQVGNAFTSELRLVAVDPMSARPALVAVPGAAAARPESAAV